MRHSVHHARELRTDTHEQYNKVRAEVIVQYPDGPYLESAIDMLEAAFIAALSELIDRREAFDIEQAEKRILAVLEADRAERFPLQDKGIPA